MNAKGHITKAKSNRLIFNPNNHTLTDSLRVRRGKYAHYCFDHNDLLIDENDKEFITCECGRVNPRT